MPPLRFSALLAAALVLTGTVANDASAQGRGKDNWEQLGCEEVGRRSDLDVIKVGRREGRFKAIRLSASGNDVRVEDLKVVYAGGGAPDDIRVRSELREGADTRPLDLKGRDRAIDRIELTTKRDFKGRGKGKAKVCVSASRTTASPTAGATAAAANGSSSAARTSASSPTATRSRSGAARAASKRSASRCRAIRST